GPAPARLFQLGFGCRSRTLEGAASLALAFGYPGCVETFGLGMGVDLLTPAHLERYEGSHGQPHQQRDDHVDRVHACTSSAAAGVGTFARGPDAILAITRSRMWSTRSGRVVSGSTAFSLPCPRRVSPKAYQLPDFCTTSMSAATCTRSPRRSMPRPNKISTSASRKGGATLFLVTFTRTRDPTRSAPTLTSPLRRTSRRTLA